MVIVHPYSQHEVSNPVFGGTRLISEQIRYFKEEGYEVRIISLMGLGSFTSYCYSLQAKLRIGNRNAKNTLSSEMRRWRLNLIQVLINDYVSRIDILFKYKIKKLFKQIRPDSTIIYHYPYSSAPFISNSTNSGVRFALYEHNIEWRFFEERIEKNVLNRFLVHIAKRIELECMKKVDVVIFVTEKDRLSIINEKQLDGLKSITWVPSIKSNIALTTKDLDYSIKKQITGKIVIGFVGTNFGPNIIAVKDIMHMATSVDDSIVFLILGSVNKAFTNQTDLPRNIIFAGYVENLDSYLKLCDLFVNPKTSSDTGIEIKMFDYLKFDKKIITTELGARGFEGSENIIVSPVDKFPALLKELLEKKRIGTAI